MITKTNIPLEVQGLAKNYGDFEALKEVTLKIQPGEVFGLLGPNGAGKTTLISCIVTLKTPTRGQCKIFGYNPHEQSVPAKLLTGFVPQEIINHGYFTVSEILTFQSGFYGEWNNQVEIEYLLKKLSLWPHRHKRVKTLSGGMKRRLLIAKALVHKPKILILDEPTAGVDVELRNSLWDFVRELRQQGTTILLTTHYLQEAERLCDRVGIIQNGEILRLGSTRGLIQEFTQRKVSIHFRENFEIQSPYFQKRDGEWTHFLLPSGVGVGELLWSLDCESNSFWDVRISEGSLEEAFLQVLDVNKKSRKK